jgi:hypothetical protein
MPFQCDFCGDPKVTQSYPVQTFDLTARLKQSADAHLRHSKFIALRDDKKAKDVRQEQ